MERHIFGSIADEASNPLANSVTSGSYTVDTTSPTAAITLVTSSPTNAETLQFTVTFSETVTGVDLSDFALVTTGTVSGTISTVTGSDKVYTVTVANVSGNGTLALETQE